MNREIPTRRMRERPDLNQLKRQAKDLLRTAKTGKLHDAQHALARSYGFANWPKLKAYVDGVTVRRLAEAVKAHDIDGVRRMLRARPELADMQMSYGDERRPLHFAVMARSPEIVGLLMSHGAGARAGVHPHRRATTAWTLASERGYDEIVAIIEEAEAKRPQEGERHSHAEAAESEARRAVAAGDIDWLSREHEHGRLSNDIQWDSGGLLTVAIRSNQPGVLRTLLDFGFDPNERTSEGGGDWIAYSQGYPLWHCAALGRREMAEMLLAKGADPNVHVDSSGSSVYSAFSHRQWEMAELLQRHGGVVTADIASIYRRTDLATSLLDTHAEELLQYGASGGATEIVGLALRRIERPPDDPQWFRWVTEPLTFWHHIPWLYAGAKDFSRESYLECFRMILARCNVNVAGGFGRTILHEIAAMGDWVTEEEAEAFALAALDAGADTKRRDDLLNSTPLGWACRWRRLKVARALLDRGADAVGQDAESWARPAAWATRLGDPAIVELLRARGG